MGRLSGKIALVTGGASRPGLGSTTAEVFAREGAIVYIADLDLAATQAVAEDLTGAGGDVRALKLDVRDEAEWNACVDKIFSECGGFDVLVNNAGIAALGPIEAQTDDIFSKTVDVNLRGTFLGMQAAIKAIRAGGKGGSIINMSSVAGLNGAPYTLAYSASKAGVTGMSRTAAVELAPEKIRVNTIHPGNTLTNMILSVAEDNPDLIKQTTAAIPMGIMMEPIDIANCALFLASDESRYMTGAMLVIDGGQSID